MRRAFAIAVAPLACGCSMGVLQTAKTQKPGTVSGVVGISWVDQNRYAAAGVPWNERRQDPFLFPEAGVRMGIADRVDAGVGSYLGLGMRGDVKVSLLPREERLAIAPRAGIGFASSTEHAAFVAMAGGIVSYDVASWLTPYASATFANHWIGAGNTQDASAILPGERYASHTPFGDGLVQLVAGISLHADGGPMGAVLEAGRWLPAQNDPGDGFRFVPASVFVGAIRFCTDCP